MKCIIKEACGNKNIDVLITVFLHYLLRLLFLLLQRKRKRPDINDYNRQPLWIVKSFSMTSSSSRMYSKTTSVATTILPRTNILSMIIVMFTHPALGLPIRGLPSRICVAQQLLVIPLIWPAHWHFRSLIRYAMFDNFGFLSDHLVPDSILQRNSKHRPLHSSLSDFGFVFQDI